MALQSSRKPICVEDVLFGASADPHIVCIEPDARATITVFRRAKNAVSRTIEPYRPWLLAATRADQAPGCTAVSELNGEGLRYLCEFENQADAAAARVSLRDGGVACTGYTGAKAAFVRTGKTLFKRMRFEELLRMQVDIETMGLDPAPEQNRVIIIAVADSAGRVELIEGDEPEILQRFVELVSTVDPDVLEGHNIFGFDLPFLMARAKRHKIRLGIGRNLEAPTIGRERNYAIGGSTRPFAPVNIYGRHVLDTYLIVQRYDWAKGLLNGFGLKECARTYALACDDRVEIPGDQIGSTYLTDPERVREYARQDIIETRRLADLITPVEFYQTQMAPDNYGQVAVTGTGERINSVFMRAYLHAGTAVPLPQSSEPFPGGYTEVRRTGVLERVVKADVESLYPSLMLTNQIAPAADALGVFLPCLNELTQRRIDAKRMAADAPDATWERYWDGLQSSFKILINSFYGYLAGPFPWNDYRAARLVTELGRALVVDVAERIEQQGGLVIEIDTDGVYFVPPASIINEAGEREFVDQIGKSLQHGIRLAFDGRYGRMLSVKTKNYVLETYEGKRVFKGSSLRSRADERFGRRFLESAVGLLLRGDHEGVGRLYTDTLNELLQHRIDIDSLARRVRVTHKTSSSDLLRRSRRAAEGVAIGDHVMVFEKADGEVGPVSEYHAPGDENAPYYAERLYRFAKRLEDAFGGDFDRYIQKPKHHLNSPGGSGQASLDLFS